MSAAVVLVFRGFAGGHAKRDHPRWLGRQAEPSGDDLAGQETSPVPDRPSRGARSSAGGAVRMTRAVRDAVLDHARRTLPDECCGLLIGTALGDETHVSRAWPARNLRSSPTRYLIDPADHFAAIRTARRNGLRVVGAYHSHPTSPPSPSETDAREADDGELVYLIASPALGAVRGYRLAGGRLRPVELRTTVSPGTARPGR